MEHSSADIPMPSEEEEDRAIEFADNVAERMIQHTITFQEGVEELMKAGMEIHHARGFLQYVRSKAAREKAAQPPPAGPGSA